MAGLFVSAMGLFRRDKMADYAVVSTGGKQYRVRPDMKFLVEKLDREEGDAFALEHVLAVHDGQTLHVGEPKLDGWKVQVKVVAQTKGKKIQMIKMKRRKHHMKKQGHRQLHTCLEVVEIAQAS